MSDRTSMPEGHRIVTWGDVADPEAQVAWDVLEQAGAVTWQPTLVMRGTQLWGDDTSAGEHRHGDWEHRAVCRCMLWNGHNWHAPGPCCSWNWLRRRRLSS